MRKVLQIANSIKLKHEKHQNFAHIVKCNKNGDVSSNMILNFEAYFKLEISKYKK